jgi:hypothetical protein
VQADINLLRGIFEGAFTPDQGSPELVTAINTIGTYLYSVKERIAADQHNLATDVVGALRSDQDTITAILKTIANRLAPADNDLHTRLGAALINEGDPLLGWLAVIASRIAPDQLDLHTRLGAALMDNTDPLLGLLTTIANRLAPADNDLHTRLGAALISDNQTIMDYLTTLTDRICPDTTTIHDDLLEAAGRIAQEGSDLATEITATMADQIPDVVGALKGESESSVVEAIAGMDVSGIPTALNDVAGLLNPENEHSALNPAVTSRLSKIEESIDTIPLMTLDMQVGRFGEATLSLLHPYDPDQ